MRSRAGGDALGAPHHPYANGPGVEGVADDFSSSAFDAENTHLSQVVHQQAVKTQVLMQMLRVQRGVITGFNKWQLVI